MKKNKKKIKIILIIIGIIVGIILLDSLQAFVFDNNPIIKIKEYYNGGNLYYKGKGILVDTYNCSNGEKDTVIKGFSYSCTSIDTFEIVDTTKNIKNFSCDETLEEIYEDDEFIYYLSCIKSKYIEVRYNNGRKENIISALNNGKVDIKDLDKFDIYYIKQEK